MKRIITRTIIFIVGICLIVFGNEYSVFSRNIEGREYNECIEENEREDSKVEYDEGEQIHDEKEEGGLENAELLKNNIPELPEEDANDISKIEIVEESLGDKADNVVGYHIAQEPIEGSDFLLYYYVFEDLRAVIVGYRNYDNRKPTGDIIIPDYIEGYEVIGIGKNAFYSVDSISGGKLVLPKGLLYIDSYAFCFTDIVGRVDIPDSVYYIGEGAFSQCENIEWVHFPKSTKNILLSTFNYCLNLKEIELHDKIESIEYGAFYYSGIEGYINLPANLKTVGENAFYNCKGIEGIRLNSKLENIECNAFAHTNIKGKVEFPSSLKCIGDEAFYQCTGISDIVFENGIIKIGNYSFANCSNLKVLTLADSIKELGNGAFSSCTKLENELILPANLEVIGGSAFANDSLISGLLNFSECVKTIGDYAFYNCRGLEGDITIPEGVESVGLKAFGECSGFDGTITIPSTLKSDCNNAFYGCVGIKKIINNSDISFLLPAEDETWYNQYGEEVHKLAPYRMTIRIRSNKFTYVSYQEKEEQYNYNFNPKWFVITKSNEYNQDIAKISMRLAMSTTDKNNIVDFMDELGFSEGEVSQDYVVPYVDANGECDTIGTTIGNMVLNENTSLILVAIRSGRYTKEWRGNFRVKSTYEYEQDHAGFRIAAEKVNDRVSRYIENYKTSLKPNIKIWYVGYSRGAATANMAAAKAVDGAISVVDSAGSNVYAYCFECPKNTRKGIDETNSTKYKCIWNIVNPVDFVPQVAMGNRGEWNFRRYGTTFVLPSRNSSYDYLKYNSFVTQEYLNIIKASNIKWDTYSPEMRAIYLTSFSKNCEKRIDVLLNSLTNLVKTPEEYYSGHPTATMRYNRAIEDFEIDEEALRTTWQSWFQNKAETMMGNNSEVDYSDNDKDYTEIPFLTQLKKGHYFELCLAWMDSFQSSTGGEISLDVLKSPKRFEKVIVNCPIDVEVYDETNTLVGKIENDIPYEFESGLYTEFDENGQKVIYLPGDADYQVVFTATDSGEMNVNFENVDIESFEIKELLSYRDIEINKGDQFRLNVESFAGEDNSAELIDSEENVIEPSLELVADEIKYYLVTVNLKGDGIVEGEGSFVSGEFVKLKAIPADYETFNGWKLGDEIVSTDMEYRFPVERDIELTAIFTSRENTLWIEGLKDSYEYTGKVIKPDIKVYDKQKLLTAGKDYTIVYKNNINMYTASDSDEGFDSKKAPTIVVTGRGNYVGTETVIFKIVATDISGETFSADDMAIKATSRVQTPKPVLRWNGKTVAATSYTYQYFKADAAGNPTGDALVNVKDAGRYVIVLTGKGNFTGTRNVALTLIDSTQKLVSSFSVAAIKPQLYTGVEIKPVVTVKSGKTKLIKSEDGVTGDYIVSYSNNIAVGTAKVVITGINSYVGTQTVSFKINGTPITKATVKGIADTMTYTGNDITFDDAKVYIKATKTTDEIKLTKDVDYRITYTNNQKAGKATVIFTGINGYTGVLKKTFRIAPVKQVEMTDRFKVDFTDVNVTSDGIEYSKGGAKPTVTVKFINSDGTESVLTEKTDYVLVYTKNKVVNDCSNDKNLPTVKVTFKGNYNGVITKNFKITAKSISNVVATVADKTYAKKAGAYKSVVKLTDTDGKALVVNRDYNSLIEYSVVRSGKKVVLGAKDFVEAGEVVTVTITAKDGSNYTGTKSCTYRVTQLPITSAKVVKVDSKIYIGKEITLTQDDITVKTSALADALVYGTDYEIVEGSYINNINKGTASVTIRGIGNYGGMRKISFKVKAKNLLWWWK